MYVFQFFKVFKYFDETQYLTFLSYGYIHV